MAVAVVNGMDTEYKLNLDGQDWCYTSIEAGKEELKIALEILNQQRIDEFVAALRVQQSQDLWRLLGHD